ncbi:MAG: SIR2 family protein [Bacteroidota bacterium]|nr:SIR2 family protein [Bacteroidota bacterium]
MQILIFLGSGVSYKTGLPDTKEITDRLINGEWYRSTHINFYPGKHNNEYFDETDITSEIQKFLKFLKEYCDDYLKPRGIIESNYEDIFYVVKQIYDELSLEIDNPTLKPFIEYLMQKLDYPNNPMFKEFDSTMEFRDFCWRAIDFIQCVVWNSVFTKDSPVGFELISELVNCKRIKKLNIVTLNHDLLVEKYFKENKLELIDGFGPTEGDYCKFHPNLYDCASNSETKLYKPHGSIDWYRLRLREGEINVKLVGKSSLRVFDDKGHFIGTPLNSYPNFLTGTGNKITDANYGIFKDIFFRFDKELYNTDLIIMSGYGWHDKAINLRLYQWLYSSDEKKIILLHENPDSLKTDVNGISFRYEDLVKAGKLIPVSKWMCDTILEDIIKYLDLTT